VNVIPTLFYRFSDYPVCCNNILSVRFSLLYLSLNIHPARLRAIQIALNKICPGHERVPRIPPHEQERSGAKSTTADRYIVKRKSNTNDSLKATIFLGRNSKMTINISAAGILQANEP
jgi:hypothetical protein